ncbi:hypothetical protein EVAR_92113_1 [Eumeta japonica]|uniref:Uncharacterized protein n=1 Tax=Eumeta variegata TaxID=151549 RepID=A0A4C1T1A1_EUMVA|nr:hypothetical protein EVAR_92113_1 [Eumeta japonica]
METIRVETASFTLENRSITAPRRRLAKAGAAGRLTLERPRRLAFPLIPRKYFRLYDPRSDRIFMGPGPPARLECRFFAILRGVRSLVHPFHTDLCIFNGRGAAAVARRPSRWTRPALSARGTLT